MKSLLILLISERRTRYWLRIALLISAISLLPSWFSVAQASAVLKAIVFPQAVRRSVMLDKSQWQGVSVELERLHSPTTLQNTLEQLAMLLPELTPVWSEHGVMHAHWASAEASYSLSLWEAQTHTTEGLLSGLALGQSDSMLPKTLSAQVAAIDWLPKQAQQLFRLIDKSGTQPVALSIFTVSTTFSQLVDHLNACSRRDGWVRLPNELTFYRNDTRLSFQVMVDTGQTTVLVYETSRGAP